MSPVLQVSLFLLLGALLCVTMRVLRAHAHDNEGECHPRMWLGFGGGLEKGLGNLFQFAIWTLSMWLAASVVALPATRLTAYLGYDLLSQDVHDAARALSAIALGAFAPEFIGRLAEQLKHAKWAAPMAETVDLRLRKWLAVHIDRCTAAELSRLRSGPDHLAIDRVYEHNLPKVMIWTLRRQDRSTWNQAKTLEKMRAAAKIKQIDIKFRRLCFSIGIGALEDELGRVQNLRIRAAAGAVGIPFPSWPVASNPRVESDDRRSAKNGTRQKLRWWEDDSQLRGLQDDVGSGD